MTRTSDTALTPADFAVRDPSEKRKEPRFPHARWIDILPIQVGSPAFTQADLVDCSRHGLGLVTDHPIGVGEEFLVRLRARKTVLLLYAERYCSELKGRYHIGAEFVDLPAGPFENNPQRVLDTLLEPDPAAPPG